MEKQSYTTPTLVLMAGLPGSGKTTLATALGRELHWPVLSKDRYMTWLLKRHTGMTNDEAGWEAFEQVFEEAEEFLVEQRLSLILDTAAHRSFIVEEATGIAHTAKADLKTILCTVDSQAREARLYERIASGKHPPFMSNPESLKSVDEDEYFKHLPADRKKIDTSLPRDECLARILRYLRYPESFGKV